jgi:2-hydroxychromene-2-carboxylate isomerase
MASVEFYFDYSCPWTYLAFGRLREAAMRTGAAIVWKPVLLDVVHAAAGGTPPPRFASDPRRADYQRRELAAWARYCNVPLQLPPAWPPAGAPAATGAIAAIAAGRIVVYSQRVFAAAFDGGRDIGDPAVIEAVATEAGLDPGEFRGVAGSDPALAAVRANSAELVGRGGFGSATMFVGDDMFCGNATMPLVEFALGQASDIQLATPGQHG